MWGIIPAAGRGSRIQPLAFSKELLPVGSRADAQGEHPRAVSEYLVERLTLAGADRICFVIAPGKSDILNYFGGTAYAATICYTVQPEPVGLCDAIFRALPLIPREEAVLVGMPDTVWFPTTALRALPSGELAFLLFPVDRPELFDAVLLDEQNYVREMLVKTPDPGTQWMWGAFSTPCSVLQELHALWCSRERRDEHLGTLVNAYVAQGGRALGVRAGEVYVDVGTLDGYQQAIRLMSSGPH